MWLTCHVLLEKAVTPAPTREETQPYCKPRIPMPKKRKICLKQDANQIQNAVDYVSENAKHTCEVPVILNDATIPATEVCVQIRPTVCLRGILWITPSADLSLPIA